MSSSLSSLFLPEKNLCLWRKKNGKTHRSVFQLEVILSSKAKFLNCPGERITDQGGLSKEWNKWDNQHRKTNAVTKVAISHPTPLHWPNSSPSIRIQLKSHTSVKLSWITEAYNFSLQTHNTIWISNQSGANLWLFCTLLISNCSSYSLPVQRLTGLLLKPLRSSVSWVPQGLVDYLASIRLRLQIPRPTLSSQQLVGCRHGTMFCSCRHFQSVIDQLVSWCSCGIYTHRWPQKDSGLWNRP